jgi:hypothetical protein
MAENKAQKDLMAKLLEITKANTVKERGARANTYLDRFVKALLDENGQPTIRKTRTELVAQLSYDIVMEDRAAEIAADPTKAPFNLDSVEDLLIFAEANKKVKAQIAAAVSDSKNSTALSYNPAYKDVWRVVKEGNLVGLEAIPAAGTKAE